MAYMQSFGALPSKVDIRDYVAQVTAEVDYPEEFELKMCSVKNQGSVGSCVAHSISEVVEYFNQNQEGEYVRMSTGYIYGNRIGMGWDGEGMYTSDAIHNTVKYGTVPNELFDVNVEVPAAITRFSEKSFELAPSAFPNRFSSYFRLTSESAIKASLIKNGPVIFAIKWYSDYKVVNGLLVHDEANKAVSGHHCMVIYGWNKQGWKIQNSWGTSWGNQGRAVLPYATKLSEAYGVIDEIYTKSYEDKIQQLEKLNEEYAEHIEEYTQKIQQLNDAIVQKDAQYEQVTITLNQIIKQLDETELYNDKLEQRYDEIKNTLSNIEEQKEKLQKEYETNKKELDKYIELNKEQQSTIDALNQKIIEIEKPYANWNSTFVKIINWIVNLFKKRK